MDLPEFERAVQAHRRAVLAYVYASCRDLTLAEDIVQETLVIAMTKRDKYWPESDFGTWLISIARHIWLRECRRRRIHEKAVKFIQEHAATIFSGDFYNEDEWHKERVALPGCLQKLQEQDRALLEHHFNQRLKYEQIARKFNRTMAWVKARMYRAREALRACVQMSNLIEETES